MSISALRQVSGLLDTAQTRSTARTGVIGTSPAIQAALQFASRAASSTAPVFLTGESGTGKEVFAEYIHRNSERASAAFIAINCAAIPHDLTESELFGHLKGAFTGAISDRAGAALQADRGTLFLDEICEMPLAAQVKLLRFLQTGQIQRVGSSRIEQSDVRIICATNREPAREVEAGHFRRDLYYRLQVVPIELPRLADRGDDILRLAEYFLDRFAREEGRSALSLSPEARQCLLSHSWPGNVRELQNVLRRAVVLNDGQLISEEMLPKELQRPSRPVGEMVRLEYL